MTASFGGRTATRAYDSLSRLTSVTRTNGTSSTYTYEIDSDLATLTHAFASGSTPTSATWGFTSDASAKVTGITISAPAFEWTPPTDYGRTYGAASNLNQVTSENGIPVTWNTDGNMTSDGVNTYSWTWGNRMMGASRSGMTATYDYDSDDRRTKKTVNGVVTRTMWSGADEVGEYNAAGTLIRRFIPDGTGGMDARLITVEASGTAYWHHTDRQGSVVATSNAAGQVVATATYSPHGEFGTGVTAPPTGSPFGYTGRQYDPETGLYQYRARYYSPRLGVFLSTDPIGTKDDPNLYLYVGADPVNHTDPTGMTMDPGDKFPTLEEAAEDWVDYVEREGSLDSEGNIIELDESEYSSVIMKDIDASGSETYSYSEVGKGTQDGFRIGITADQASRAVAWIHNHNSDENISQSRADELGRPSTSRDSRNRQRNNAYEYGSDNTGFSTLSGLTRATSPGNFRTFILGPRAGPSNTRTLRQFRGLSFRPITGR